MALLKRTPDALTVTLSHLVWMKPLRMHEEIISYWHLQGYAEAESLPYFKTDGCLEVTCDLPEYGFHKGTGTLCKEIYDLPF